MEIKGYDNLVFFDTETTGFDAEKNQIIELAAIRIGSAGRYDMDRLIKPPDGVLIPDKIVELTHITDRMLSDDGVSEMDAAAEFAGLLMGGGKTLLVAHNAQFDLNFIAYMFYHYYEDKKEWMAAFNRADYIDTVTVYKDRRKYPHKLLNAIEAYNLSDKVKNSHRAIDDVEALLAVTEAMQAERDDLHEYVNIFGFNNKYGVSGKRLKKVTYHAQSFRDYMATPEQTLPAIIRR